MTAIIASEFFTIDFLLVEPWRTLKGLAAAGCTLSVGRDTINFTLAAAVNFKQLSNLIEENNYCGST